MNKFYECGGCDHLHPLGWDGDCRNDNQRYSQEDLDKKFGPLNWEIVDETEIEEK